jgi:hypothetical protein
MFFAMFTGWGRNYSQEETLGEEVAVVGQSA